MPQNYLFTAHAVDIRIKKTSSPVDGNELKNDACPLLVQMKVDERFILYYLDRLKRYDSNAYLTYNQGLCNFRYLQL